MSVLRLNTGNGPFNTGRKKDYYALIKEAIVT
jgi:hypothetical protein